MNNFLKVLVLLITICLLVCSLFIFDNNEEEEIEKPKNKELFGIIIKTDNELLTVQDKDNIIYVFKKNNDLISGNNVKIEYKGNLDKNKEIQENEIISYEKVDKNIYLESMFDKYREEALEKLNKMSLDEKIAQIFLVRYPDSGVDTLKKYQFGGYVFYAKDFENKNYDEVKRMISDLQDVSKIPILTAVDEEGGKVVRVSSNPNLVNEPFKSSRELYLEGGFETIKEDTINKSKILFDLGINLNLAPVIDVSINSNDYMYSRSLGEDSSVTSQYAKEVIKASKGLGVSYTLKHFPGYGNNADTHTQAASDGRSFSDILKNDLPPFEAGIEEGAEAVLVSHNIVNSIDNENPASLSFLIHNLLRGRLGFGGIIMTDDLAMGATNDIENSTVKAILSGNDLIIVTDYAKSIKEIKEAINNNLISEKLIDRIALKIISFKYYKDMF